MKGVVFAEDSYAAMKGADALVIVTEWNAFRALNLRRVKKLLKQPVLVDLRNIYSPADMEAQGFTYYSVGRIPVGPAVQKTPEEREAVAKLRPNEAVFGEWTPVPVRRSRIAAGSR